MKKIISLLGLVMIAISLIAACSKSRAASSGTPDEKLTIGEVVISQITGSEATVESNITIPSANTILSKYLQYKKQNETEWINATADIDENNSKISGQLSGLDGETAYECRFVITGRTSAGITEIAGSAKKFTTAAGRKMLPNAPTQTVKVVVVIEDPMYDGKYLHELARWNDPRTAYPKVKEELEKASDGVVKYEIVNVIEATQFFTYFQENQNKPDRFFTKQNLKEYYVDDPNWTVVRAHEPDWNIRYDYLSMVKHYGFDDMRTRDEVNEVWVCSFTINGMYESNYVSKAGKGFWLNSEPTEGASNDKLLTVMYYNYERGIAEAIHSNGHRLESIMKHVYGRWATEPPAKQYTPGMALNNWEKFTLYNAIAPGKGQLGCTHYPVNAVSDYDYENPTKVTTYRNAWKYYPDIREVDSDKETVNADTWKKMANGDAQLGCMINLFSHIPNKAGINPQDHKLNNWWHYLVNYESALELENKPD